MKREIKFRAWSDNLKDKGEMYYQYISSFLNPLFSPAGYGLLNPTLKIMQYTGLKDRNGKEIYEGDIVIPNIIDEPCVVEYSDIMCRFVLIRPIGTFTDIQNTREVIGNIYENPDLISKNE